MFISKCISWVTIEVKAYLLTDLNLTLLMSFKTSSMFGISTGFESKNVWPCVFFPLRSFIKSMAENVRWRLEGGGSGGGGGGGGGTEPEGGGGSGGVPVEAAEVKQRKEKKIFELFQHVKFCCHLVDKLVITEEKKQKTQSVFTNHL